MKKKTLKGYIRKDLEWNVYNIAHHFFDKIPDPKYMRGKFVKCVIVIKEES